MSLFNLVTAYTLHKVLTMTAGALHSSWLHRCHSVHKNNHIPDLQCFTTSLIYKYMCSMNWLDFENITQQKFHLPAEESMWPKKHQEKQMLGDVRENFAVSLPLAEVRWQKVLRFEHFSSWELFFQLALLLFKISFVYPGANMRCENEVCTYPISVIRLVSVYSRPIQKTCQAADLSY